MSFSHSRSHGLRRALALVVLPAILVLGGCNATVHRTVTRGELVPADDVVVESARTRSGRAIVFDGTGAVTSSGTHVGGIATTGESVSLPLDSIAELEIRYQEPSAAKWAVVLSSIAGAGALFVAAVAVPK